MSFATFYKFDETFSDIFDDKKNADDVKYTFKSKAKGPNSTTFTSTSEYVNNKIDGKFALKWAGPSGFTVNKLEINKDGKIGLELENKLPNGLLTELNLKDVSTDAEVKFTYKHSAATISGSVDARNLNKAALAVFGGVNKINLGAEVQLADKALSGYNFAVGYQANDKLNVTVRAANKLNNFSSIVSYVVNNDTTVAAWAGFDKAAKSQNFKLATIYACNANTTLKFQATSSGKFSASAKQTIDKLSLLVLCRSLKIT